MRRGEAAERVPEQGAHGGDDDVARGLAAQGELGLGAQTTVRNQGGLVGIYVARDVDFSSVYELKPTAGAPARESTP